MFLILFILIFYDISVSKYHSLITHHSSAVKIKAFMFRFHKIITAENPQA